MDGRAEPLERALALYRGELLPAERDESWATERRTALADLLAELLLRLAALRERDANLADATDLLRRLLNLDASQQEAHRRMMRLYARQGHRHLALRQFQLCREALSRELDVEPEPETASLYEEILAGRGVLDTNGARAANRRPPLPSPLRHQSTGPLIGRDQVLAEFREQQQRAAAGHGSTLLIDGEAGVGKSRLAAQGRHHVSWAVVAARASVRGASERFTGSRRALVLDNGVPAGGFQTMMNAFGIKSAAGDRAALRGRGDSARVAPSKSSDIL